MPGNMQLTSIWQDFRPIDIAEIFLYMIQIVHNPTGRQLTVFGLLWLAAFGILGTMAWWRTSLSATAYGFWTIAALVPAVGFLWPSALRIVYLLSAYITFPIGFVVSFVILAMVYYLVLTPIGLVMRLTGYDPMQRRFNRDAKTYWTPREQDESTEQYFRQF